MWSSGRAAVGSWQSDTLPVIEKQTIKNQHKEKTIINGIGQHLWPECRQNKIHSLKEHIA